ncbi:(E3-independent) E2 ubiquitin-conjugating enzyme isoform X3 [Leptidea sinapis]|uniref:(E3-independent) E2 ubiquitin-conjugating enzyme isoform X3 n=1 Tax=Leptidea sinapis TaxID=189913 RepID=UPI002142DCB7|nr:(E3-independent) E2 ubiquitin-conjugating enzyme isoform X3 [Leptidea sinapis]
MAGQNPGSPTDFQYFYEDEVYKINNRGQVVFGLVLENFEASSSDPESDIETPIQKGEIRVVWHPSGTERVVSEKSVGLADRSLMPGDVVRRLIAGKDTQRGYCRDIEMTAALQIVGTKHVIQNVASERLQPLEEFTPDLAVCLESWVGTSKSVHSKLRLVSSDGSRLEFPDLDSCALEDYSNRRRRATPYSSSEFYPGQVVFGPLAALDNANWLHMTKEMKAAKKHKMNDHKFTVESVTTESLSVHWQCRALCTNTADTAQPQPPKFLVEGEDLKRLKLLNVFEPCTLQVGDRNFLTIGPEDTFISKKQWRKEQSKYFRNLRKQSRPKKKSSKSDTSAVEHMPSRPKKRASSNRKLKLSNIEMDVDIVEENLESLDEELKVDINCPSIRIEPSSDVALPIASHDENTTEEKNDSGISPEPMKEDGSLLNGDRISVHQSDDDSDNWENTSTDGSDTDSGATWSSRCSSGASGSVRGKRSPQLAVRLLRGKRLKRAPRRAPPAPPPRRRDRVVVETLHTTSVANVVWQDGSIEMGIPSTQLYPIHHLDGQECFPGDFVINGAANVEDNQLKHREYGVVQRVDHHGRTAIVNWYRTYTNAEEPIPQMLHESEMSVYDLKDHPDFQYRPGTVVIRVANFTGEDANCTAGQVIDNFPTGRVKVWWVDGHTSMCWPQDLYKVGEYDSEDGDMWASDGTASEDSWETQSSAHDKEPHTPDDLPEDLGDQLRPNVAHYSVRVVEPTIPSPVASGAGPAVPRVLQPRVAAHIERGRVAMQRLEEIFAEHPALQSQEVMRKLLNLYKDCRFLDRLMGTTFFHEDHFLGLIERVKERGASTPCAGERRVHEQLARLFATESETDSVCEPEMKCVVVTEDTPITITPIVAANVTVESMEVDVSCPKKPLHLNLELGQASSSDTTLQTDDAAKSLSEQPSTKSSDTDGPRNVCYKLCSLIHAQLLKAHAEVSRQYGALVVGLADQEKEESKKEQTNEDQPADKADEKDANPIESAPLATAEGDIETEPPPEVAEEEHVGEGFCVLESAPPNHRFRLSMLQPSEPRTFYSAVKREIKLLKSDLPAGVWVRGYEDRIDLLSVMIAGPERTPYEGGLFIFDVQLGGEYPRAPPLCHYHSYCSDRLNPNLYEDGKVCVSLLGTWSGRGVEVWGKDSSLLQVIVSLQGLILNDEPYFNEAGYEKQKGTQQGKENSRMYNEMVLLKLVQSMTRMTQNPPEPFREEILQHLNATAAGLCRRLEGLVALSNGQQTDVQPPDYPLVPASRGFCLTLCSSLQSFRAALRRSNVPVPDSTL